MINLNFYEFLHAAVNKYNSSKHQLLSNTYSRGEMEALNKHIITLPEHELHVKTTDTNSKTILETNHKTYDLVKTYQTSLDNNNNFSLEEKAKFKENALFYQPPTEIDQILLKLRDESEGQFTNVINAILLSIKEGRVHYDDLLKTNDELLARIKNMENINEEQQRTIYSLKNYLDNIKQAENEKLERKQKRESRKRRPQTQPFTHKDFEIFMNFLNKPDYSIHKYHTKLRVKVALIIFICTGIRISELRLIKVSQALSLIRKNQLAISRVKRGRENHKAFLSKTGKKIVTKYAPLVIEFMITTGVQIPDESFDTYYIPPYDDLYLFSSPSTKGKKPYSRSYFTDSFNKIVQKVPEFLADDKNFSSHSLRHGFIKDIWNNTTDIQFVKETIGHSNIQTTMGYISQLTEEERQQKMESF